MNLFNLMAKLGLDLSEYKDALDEAENSTLTVGEKIKKSFKTSVESVDGLEGSLKKVGTGMKVVGGVMATAFGVGVKGLIDLDDAMIDFQRQTGATDEEVNKVKESLRGIHANSSLSMETLTEGFITARKVVGGTNEEMVKMAEKASIVGQKMDADVNEVLITANAISKKFGISMDEAFDAVVKGAQGSALEMDETMEIAKEFAPVFEEAGFSADEMFEVMRAGAQNGEFDINRITDAMNEFQTKLFEGNDEFRESFDKIGVNYDEFLGKFRQGGEVAKGAFVEMLSKLMEFGDQVDRETLGAMIFGTTWEDSGEDIGNALLSIKGGVESSSGAMDALANSKQKVGEMFAQLKNSMSEMAMSLAESLLPSLNNVMTLIMENQGTVNALAGAIMGVVVAIMIYKAVNFAMMLGSMVKAMYTAISTTGLLTTAQTALNGAMMMNPIGLIIGLIGGLIVAFIYLWNTSEGFRNFWIGCWETIKTFFQACGDAINGVIDNIVSWFTNLGVKLDELKAKWSAKWDEIKAKTREVVNNIVTFFKELPSKIWTAFKDTIAKATQWVSEMRTKGVESAKQLVSSFMDGVAGLPSKVLELGVKIPKMLWEGIKSMGSTLKGWVSGFFSNIFSFSGGALGLTMDVKSPSSAMSTFGGNNPLLGASRAVGGASGSSYSNTMDLSLNIGGREFDALVVKTVANNYGKIENIVQQRKRGRR